ncbi:16S rRNA (adenine(1518)-N(6)/adenine(1519)-N(6))-dimethyltransferase RsmA [Actinophytocola sp.]|uniref:16S rRNA (adenine(1518)-N(6)/adenine(1519)-N(6))- dimethyltransferase RsmA n=1 Tax=Actinophytocola sp. TaxID=1872138 RepID=UPI003D6A756F
MSDRDGDSALLGPADVRRLAADLGIRPTKKLGQNFVHDPNTVRRTVAAARLTPDDVVVEVGPGLGSLTLALLPACRAVHAVEVDPVLAGQLPRTVERRAPGLSGRLHVIEDDAVRISADRFPEKPTALVANLPYNVSVPVVLHLLAELPTLNKALVMVQAEVADRMAAGPGSKVYGVPSVKIAWYATAKRVATVPRTVFWPVPNVDSALVLLERHDEPRANRKEVFRLVDAAFAQRRKTLRAALAGWAGSAERAAELLTAAGIDPGSRGERLTVDDFSTVVAAAAR